MMTIECRVSVREAKDDGPWLDDKLIIRSHWNYRETVEITLNGKAVYVHAPELMMALQNCMNHK